MRSSMCQKRREAGDSEDKAGEAGERTSGRAGHLYQEFGVYLGGHGSTDEIKQRRPITDLYFARFTLAPWHG